MKLILNITRLSSFTAVMILIILLKPNHSLYFTAILQPTLSQAGGVGLYIRNNTEFHIREDLSCMMQEFESLWIEIHCNPAKNIICGVLYRHPNGKLETFNNYLFSAVNKISKENKYCAFMGDFNINLLNVENCSFSEDFVNTLGSYYFLPQILQPTRITDHTATLIDNIFLSSTEHYPISGNIVHDITDHLPNFLIINKLASAPRNLKFYKRDYSKLNEHDLLADVQSINWHEILSHHDDINQNFNSFHSCISSVIDKHAPIRQLSKKEVKLRTKPWITSGLRKSITTKNRLYHAYLRNRSSDFQHSKYKAYRNKLKHILSASKKLYYSKFFSDNVKNMKNTWKGIKQLINTKTKNKSFPSKIVLNNKSITDTSAIADTFNEYFANIGSDLAKSIPHATKSYKYFLQEPLSNSFYLSPITPEEVEEEIMNLNTNKASGPFSIPAKLLKILKYLLSYPLTYLFNSSFSLDVVPDNLKIARVIPVYKTDNHSSVSNYRPISLLSILNKLLEKLMFKTIQLYLEKYNILNDNQFGFRSNHTTTQAILMITDKIQRAIENKMISCGIYLDLSKAFDTVDHSILLNKLDHYGIRGIANDWFRSYLDNRKQFVTLGNISSEQLLVTCGVPQGSVLGPLLFLLYINDFNESSKILDFHLFADDSNLFCSHKKLQTLELTLNNELGKIQEWLCANKLSLNIKKTNFTLFHPPQKKLNDSIVLCLNGKTLGQIKSTKYLGVLMDCHLNWKDHVHNICKKLTRSIGIISKLRHFINIKTLVQLYYTLIYPFLTYSCMVWGNTYTSNLKPLEVLQKRTIRIITFSRFDAHTSPLFAQLKILKMPHVIVFQTACFMFRFSKGKLPKAFNTFFSTINSSHDYNTRLATRYTFSVPSIRSNYGKFNIRYAGPKVWNNIDESLKPLGLRSFKTLLKLNLLHLY